MVNIRKVRIGDLLLDAGVISEDQLLEALAQQKSTGQRLGATLIEMNFVDETELFRVLAKQLEVPFIELGRQKLNEDLAHKLTEVQARRYRALVVEEHPADYLVAVSDPTDLTRIDEMQSLLNKPLKIAIARESELMRAIDIIYQHTEEIENLALELDSDSVGQFDLAHLSDDVDVSEAPVVKLLQSLFDNAVKLGASDIHIEPCEKELRIRMRVDGVLKEQVIGEGRIASALVLRLKLMSDLDISEKRRPQDGRFSVTVQNKRIDVRLATLPLNHGESVVMRLLDQSNQKLQISDLGMFDEQRELFEELLANKHGIILVTGPTGSGKSTTLYSALNKLNREDTKIITVEDPIEYELKRINQVQVNTKIGLSFAQVLRTVLRADPDIIMVGEMRDQETAEIGLRAALTGHLVLSTLHTNNALQSAMRLVEMDIEPYLVASTLKGVIAQRLIRRLCGHCSVPAELNFQQQQWLDRYQIDHQHFMTATGCQHCHESGYAGRIGIYEVLRISDSMATAIRNHDQEAFAEAAKACSAYRPLFLSALQHAIDGVTSLDEVLRVCQGFEQ